MFIKILFLINLISTKSIILNAFERDEQTQQQQTSSFDKTIENITVKVGQQAILPCFINNLGSYSAIWSKSGDVLTFGTSKINTDNRLNIQHRYVSEWHLMIDNVVTDDEGEYICKTNGDFFKIVNLQVLIPPSIDDLNSTPAGTITIKEGASLTLKCFADGKPTPMIKWYRWKKYKKFTSEKEELENISNEIHINSIKRNDANIYECIAKNSVPPATSRIFNIEIQFLPTIELNVRKTFQYLHKQISLECKISANPVDKIYWSKNGIIINQNDHHYNHNNNYPNSNNYNQNIIEKYDNSNINDFYKIILTLTIMSLKKHDFGEYQCCAENLLGTTCSNVFLQEIKVETTPIFTSISSKSSDSSTKITSTSRLLEILTNNLNNELNNDDSLSNIVYNEYDTNYNPQTNPLNDIDNKLNDTNINNFDFKDKRRHFALKNSKDYLNIQPQISSKSTRFTFNQLLAIATLILMLKF